MKARLIVLAVLACWVIPALAQAPSPLSPDPIVVRVGDTGFLQLEAESFRQLDAKHQALAYWLTRASIAIDPIIYDQLSQFGLRQKRLLEGIVAHPSGVPSAALDKIRNFTLLFWANRGNHNETTGQKFLPAFSAEELRGAALKALANGAFKNAYADLPPLSSADALTKIGRASCRERV